MKDLFSIVFSAVAIIIAILTYRRARATVLQPIRNEVIKKQSELLVEILDFLPSDGKLIHEGLEYPSIVVINVYKHLSELGFIFAKHEEQLERIEEQIVGWIYVGERRTLSDIEVIGTFEDEKIEKSDDKDLGRTKYENAKEGIIELNKVYVTRNHQDFTNKLIEFYKNPYLPRGIQEILKKIIDDIRINLHVNMKSVLTEFFKEFCAKYFYNKDITNFNPIGVFNSFNHRRLTHEQDIKRLREEVRRYLMIDNKWR